MPPAAPRIAAGKNYVHKEGRNINMANQVLLNNISYLERLLSAMEEKITRMSQLSASIQKEELYYSCYELTPNIFKLPKSLKFHPILKFYLWLLCFAFLLCGGEVSIILATMHLLANLYLMKRVRSKLLSFIVWSCTLFFGTFILLMLPFSNTDYMGRLYGSKFLIACLLAYLATFIFAKRFIDQVNRELEVENDHTEQSNERLRSRNETLMAQCRSLNEEIRALQNQVADAVQRMSYPPDYVCLDAARFFIHALRNDRADDFRQLIDLYEKNNYRLQMLESQRELAGLMNQQIVNQERMTQLLHFSNGLSAANLAAQIQTQAEIRALGTSLNTTLNTVSAYGHRR